MKALSYFAKLFSYAQFWSGNVQLNTQHTTVFLTHALLWPVAGVQFAGIAQKDASRKKSEVGGVGSESIGSLSPSPSPLIFSPVCDSAPHFTNCLEQASSLATSHIFISNNIGFLPLLNLDLSFRGTFFPGETNHIQRVNADRSSL